MALWDVEGDKKEVILLANFSISEVGDERSLFFGGQVIW